MEMNKVGEREEETEQLRMGVTKLRKVKRIRLMVYRFVCEAWKVKLLELLHPSILIGR